MATCAIAGVLPPSSAPAVPIVITLIGLPLRFVLCGLCAVLPPLHPAAASRAAVTRATPAVVDRLLCLILLIVHPTSCQATDANNPARSWAYGEEVYAPCVAPSTTPAPDVAAKTMTGGPGRASSQSAPYADVSSPRPDAHHNPSRDAP